LADLATEGLSIDAQRWKDVGAFGVIKFRALVAGERVRIEFRLYEIEKGSEPVLSRSYTGDVKDVRRLTHRFSNEVHQHLTGEKGFFGSKMVFTVKAVSPKGKRYSRIMVMDFDGHGVRSMSKDEFINILPVYSRDGGRIAFTSYAYKNPDLFVVPTAGGTARRISNRYGMNLPGSFSPDGGKIAATLSKDGNPEIYILDANSGAIGSRLTENKFIDTSPAYSPDGSQIAFESDRQGGPQIFVMPAGGGEAKRISFNGSYNTTPDWSPVKGKRILAYTTRAEDGSFDVIAHDLDTNEQIRITQDDGNYEEPSFAPNGRAIAFARSGPNPGIYISAADGTGDPVQVYKGAATSVSWGPFPNL
jgi:TolB protein